MDVPLVHKMDLRNVNSRQARAPSPGARRTIRNSVRRGADLTPAARRRCTNPGRQDDGQQGPAQGQKAGLTRSGGFAVRPNVSRTNKRGEIK